MRKKLIFIIESQYEVIKTVRIWNVKNILSPDCFIYVSNELKSDFFAAFVIKKSLKNILLLYLKYSNIELVIAYLWMFYP